MFAGVLTFGDVMQSVAAFGNVQSSLSFFRSVYDAFAGYRAAIIRLDGLVTANEQARALPRLAVEASTGGAVELGGRGRELAHRGSDRRRPRPSVDSGRLVGDHWTVRAPGRRR